MNFKPFQQAVAAQFAALAGGELFVTDVSKDELWEHYLASFPAGTNPIYKERTEHDCQCCKQFIRACGNVVAIVNGIRMSIWDIMDIGEENAPYQAVAAAMKELVESRPIVNKFLHYEKILGTEKSNVELYDKEGIYLSMATFYHFHYVLDSRYVKDKDLIGSLLAKSHSNKDVIKSSLEIITREAVNTVMELIDQGSIYRGEEFADNVDAFSHIMSHYEHTVPAAKDNYCWAVTDMSARIKNTAIGSLLIDLSEGVDLTDAVKMFESKVAPENYKRSSALITKGMILKAQAKVAELGIEASLPRRHAVTDDITINNVLYADRTAQKEMGVFDTMIKEAPAKDTEFDVQDEVSIDKFLTDILPTVSSVELMVDNKHTGNMMSLIAPVDPLALGILKWNNNFSWAYQGEVADSMMKKRVKNAGGNVDGILRFSIQWNTEDRYNANDFDAHCLEPNGNAIYYPSKGRVHPSSGILDVDIVTPGHAVAVENITFSDFLKMPDGDYSFFVHCYSHNGGRNGFSAEIEFAGQIFSFDYPKNMASNETIVVGVVNHKDGVFTMKSSLPSTKASKKVWDIDTQQFQRVSMIMNSPNHWDGNKTGNKHVFFMLEGCKNPVAPRGFFNEFLDENLSEHRKVFEVLGSKMRVEPSDNQLSGLGFSTTQRNSALVRVKGAFTRTIKINF